MEEVVKSKGTINTSELDNKVTFFMFKRLFDVVGSMIGLILLVPLFILVAILMKIEEPRGPIFYSQIRVGKDQREFKMYKIRSMCVDADKKLAELLQHNEVEGAMFKMKDDPRITRVGKLIRKTSIDELPQLWNVIKGDMSLVGPRPPLPREVKLYSNHDKQRLLVKPGCTGLWQISGRNEVGFDEMVALDLQYIKNASVKNDVEIMVKTVGVMLKPNGAY